MEASRSPPKYCFVLLSFTVLIYQLSLISCTHELRKISTTEGRPNEKGWQIWDSEIRWQKKIWDSETQKSLKNETSRPIKNISEISRLGQNFSRPAFFEVPFYTPLFPPKPLEKFTDEHITHISAQKICSINKYRIQGHNSERSLARSAERSDFIILSRAQSANHAWS